MMLLLSSMKWYSIHNDCMKQLELQKYLEIPSESAELASMTMELFSMEYWDTFYENKEEFIKAKLDFFKGIVKYLPQMLIVDQFQHWMYENPNHTAKERNEKYLELHNTYQSNIVNIEGMKIGLQLAGYLCYIYSKYHSITSNMQLHNLVHCKCINNIKKILNKHLKIIKSLIIR